MPHFARRTAGVAALAAGLGFAAPEADAATATTSFAVTLTVLSECIVTATPMAFGSLSLVAAGGSATSTITVTCTAQTPFTIGLDAGAGPGATVATRLMRGPAPATTSTVPYSLYQDAAHTILWGDTAGAVVTGGPATGLPQVFNVYGQLLPRTGAAPTGAYADTIGVTVTY